MLVELHVVDLGIVADLDLVLGAGPDRDHRRDRRGQDARSSRRSSCSSAARADAVARARRRATRRASKAGSSTADTGEEIVLARVVPRRRSQPGVRRRPTRDRGELAELGATLVDLHGQHAHQSLLASGRAARRARPLRRRAGARRARRVPRRARGRSARDRRRARTALGGDDRARARGDRPARASRSRRSTAPGSTIPARTSRSKPRRRCSPTPSAHREALTARVRRARGPGARRARRRGRRARRPRAVRRAGRRACARSRPSSPTSSRSCGSRRERGHRRSRSGSRPSGRGASCSATCGRKYGDTLADVLAYARRGGGRGSRELEGYEARAAALEARAAPSRGHGAIDGRRRALGGPPRRGRAARPRRSQEHLRRAGDAARATIEVVVEPGEPTDDGADRVTFLLAANPGEAARPLARAASGGELSRAMLALRVVLLGGAADAGVRRGRRRDRRRGRDRGRSLLAALGATRTRCCASRTSRRWRRSPTRRSWWRRPWRRGGAGQRAHVGAATSSTATSASPSSRGCSPGVGDSSHARRHAAELLERPASARRAPRAGGAWRLRRRRSAASARRHRS